MTGARFSDKLIDAAQAGLLVLSLVLVLVPHSRTGAAILTFRAMLLALCAGYSHRVWKAGLFSRSPEGIQAHLQANGGRLSRGWLERITVVVAFLSALYLAWT
jgi:hypothetical protein